MTGQWHEKLVAVTSSKETTNLVSRNLPCGSEISLYATAWNAQGTSPPSEILVTSTIGSFPPRPQPSTIVEVNSTCVILRLYSWPEDDCPVQHWRVIFEPFLGT